MAISEDVGTPGKRDTFPGAPLSMSGEQVLSEPGVSRVTIPAGHMVCFEVVGGGGAGGHWGGSAGRPGMRLTGTIPARPVDWGMTLYCGEGGQVDLDTSGGGPALGGLGGDGFNAGGAGSWGSNWAAGGGGGGGGSSAIISDDASVSIIAPGGGGGGGGGQDPAGVNAVSGVDASIDLAPTDALGAGGNGCCGTSRKRVAGGGGGGGGGGSPSASGGSGGNGGGSGGDGGDGIATTTGGVLIVTSRGGPDDADTSKQLPEPGDGGRPGHRSAAQPEAFVDARLATSGGHGLVHIWWAAVGSVAGSLEFAAVESAASTQPERLPTLVDEPLDVDGPVGFGYDLVGTPYPLDTDPADRPTSLDMLLAAFPEGTPSRSSLEHVVEVLRSRLGPDQVIWALKSVDGAVRFEFYLFAAAARKHPAGLRAVFEEAVAAFDELVGWDAPRAFDGDPTLLSFEFEIDAAGAITVPTTIDASYNVDGEGSLVVNDELSTTGRRLKSVSQGFDVVGQREALQRRLGSTRDAPRSSADEQATYWLARIDAATRCEICWTSFKTHSDAVYLSRTHIDDLIALLDEFAYPDHLRAWVRSQRVDLDHLRYDLCYDYRVESDRVVVNRTAFCGWF